MHSKPWAELLPGHQLTDPKKKEEEEEEGEKKKDSNNNNNNSNNCQLQTVTFLL